MIQFSIDNYTIHFYIGKEPLMYNYYKERALFIDNKGLQDSGTEVYIIITTGFTNPTCAILAFKTDPVGYSGFDPALHYVKETEVLFIGAGTIIKTIRLSDYKMIFEKNYGVGFWGWIQHNEFLIQQEELAVGIFTLTGVQLWEMGVSPPYNFELTENLITLKFDDIVDSRFLASGRKK